MITLNTVDLINKLKKTFQEVTSEVFYLENTKTEEIYPYLIFSYSVHSDQINKKNLEIKIELSDDKKTSYERNEMISSELIRLVDNKTIELGESSGLVQLDSIVIDHEETVQTDLRKKVIKIKGRIN